MCANSKRYLHVDSCFSLLTLLQCVTILCVEIRTYIIKYGGIRLSAKQFLSKLLWIMCVVHFGRHSMSLWWCLFVRRSSITHLPFHKYHKLYVFIAIQHSCRLFAKRLILASLLLLLFCKITILYVCMSPQ